MSNSKQVYVDADLHHALKKRAAKQRSTIQKVLGDLLGEALKNNKKVAS
jgi:hypothetical protein